MRGEEATIPDRNCIQHIQQDGHSNPRKRANRIRSREGIDNGKPEQPFRSNRTE